MGKSIVLYASFYGSTQRYADYIAHRLACEAVNVRQLKPEDLKEVDTVIFGGWLCGGAVMGCGVLMRHRQLLANKRLLAFVTGVGEYNGTAYMNDVISSNFIHLLPEKVFYLRGDIHYRRMRWYHKFLINYLMFEDNNKGRKWLKQEGEFFRESQADDVIAYIKSR